MCIPPQNDPSREPIVHHHPVNLVEFCAGYCGIGLGLRSVVQNLRTIAYVEREAYAAANLAAKIEAGRLDAAPIWSDLLDFPYAKFRGLVDIASAGIPCQPHSHAGLRRGGATSDSSLTTGLPESSKCVRAASSSKTSKDSLPVRCQMELFASAGLWKDWSAWDTGLRAAYSARKNAARHILGSVFSFWPTPTTAEAGKISNRRNYGQIGLSNHPAIRGKEMARQKSLKNRNGQPGQNTSNMNGSLEESAKLNPAWVESLLGLPPGWTDCASSETESSQQPPH